MNIKKNWLWIAGYIVIDLLCAGLGMGVPFFNILLGFPLGWFLVHKLSAGETRIEPILKNTFILALLASAFTLLVMCLIWGGTVALLFDPTADLANFGIPQILYTPVASFIGWLVLMVFISPFMQLLVTIFSAHVTLLVKLSGPWRATGSNCQQ